MHERNTFLARTHKNTEHHFSFDQQTGKYFLEYHQNQKMQINKNGKMLPQFIPKGSGFFAAKQRYEAAQQIPAAMHYVPNMKIRKTHSLYTPKTHKFTGYAQYPFKSPQTTLPEYLLQTEQAKNNKTLLRKTRKSILQIVETPKPTENAFFESSMMSMINSKSMPKKNKRTCYNNQCRYLSSINWPTTPQFIKSTKLGLDSTLNETLNKSYFNNLINKQQQVSRLIQ